MLIILYLSLAPYQGDKVCKSVEALVLLWKEK
jgi:hypothetical protein